MGVQKLRIWGCGNSTLAAALVATALAIPVVAQTTIYNFKGDPDGAIPTAPLIRDSEGNLYGTTETGGIDDGTVFKISSSGEETILHTFTGSPDGASPWGGLVRDQSGTLYGTTGYGGEHNAGTVFKVTEAGEESVLYSFRGVPDGAVPIAGLVLDSDDNLYGVTLFGGTENCTSESGQKGCGTVFSTSASGAESVLHSFAGGSDGQWPNSPLIRDSSGNLYGTTEQGGPAKCSDSSVVGCGTLFKLASDGTKTMLHSFSGYPTDGEDPQGVIFGPGGNLFGTTVQGGAYGSGSVFKLSLSGAESLFYSFTEFSNPNGGLVVDGAGRLFGTTQEGGGTECAGEGCGTVFEVTSVGQGKTLVSFSEFAGGCVPFSGLTRDSAGYLYGTTTDCGDGWGTVFGVKP